MPQASPKPSRTLKLSKSLWIQSSLVVAANALFLGFLADGAIEKTLAVLLSAALAFFIWRNYTVSQQSAKDYEEREAQLAFVFNSVPIGIHWAIYRKKGDEAFAEKRFYNPAHLEISGMTEEEMRTPGSFASITHPQDFERQREARQQLTEGNMKEASLEKRYIRKDGSVSWVKVSWKRQYTEDGKGFQEVSCVIDITNQKLFAEKLERARIAAEEANLSKSQFLASMSHEIRTPMNGMIGTLHILESQLDEENLKYLNIARNSANDLLALINDILDFSKIEAGKMELESREFPIDESIDRASEIHANNAFEKGLNLRCSIEPNAAVQLLGDPLKFRQVLSNLLSNAIKFTERGEIILGARLVSENASDDTLEIYVQDTGIGLNPLEKDQLFHAFTQANASTTRKYGGTGLGLSICKSIVERMQGRIGVESEEGKGSTFWIRFPSKDLKPLSELRSPLPQDPPKQVILVDSCPKTLDDMQSWLSLWECESWTASNAPEAMDLMNSRPSAAPLDLLILESTLFKKSEKAWQKRIADNANLKNTKIVILDRNSNNPHKDSYNNVGTLLSKPIRIQQLKALLTHTMAQSTAPSDSPQPKFDFSKTKLLVVEDIPVNRLVVTKLLEQKHGIKADTAANGIEAIERIKANRYDIVLMDCMMPEMDGYDATRAIRKGEAGEANRELPIIALTANATEDDQEDCRVAGMSDHLSKPIGPAQILSILQKWIAEK